jgi:uncharacterized cupin superfamily protein
MRSGLRFERAQGRTADRERAVASNLARLAGRHALDRRQSGTVDAPENALEFTVSSALPQFNARAISLENAVPQPVVFAAPADIELLPAPILAQWIIEGAPRARSKRLATSADGTVSVIAWSCTPGRFNWHYAVDEILHIISGEVFVADENGESRRLGSGDMAFFPAGCSSLRHVTKEVRKLAVRRLSMPRPLGFAPRAWNKLARVLSGADEDGIPFESGASVRADPERVTAV